MKVCNVIKKAPIQVISCEICKIFKNNYFEDHLWTATSKLYLKRHSNTGVCLWILWIIQEHIAAHIMYSIYEHLILKQQWEDISSIKLQAWRPEGL